MSITITTTTTTTIIIIIITCLGATQPGPSSVLHKNE